jgi:ribonuclease Z
MSLAIRLLGTSASRPTVERNVASLAIVREGETLLFDCGEGTQRQMMRYGVSFGLADIFFTHFHADHVIGVIGLMRTMSLQGRTDPLRLWGPRGAARMLKRAEDFGMDRLSFPLEITELEPGQSVARQDYAIVPFPVDHRGARAVGYAVVEEERKGRFNPDLARELGIPEGPLRAVETGHSTAREAATIAASAGVGTLLLVHFSARYSRDASDLGKEAREVFERTLVGKDGMELEIPYRSDAQTV